MLAKEFRTKIAYTMAWILYTLRVKGNAKLPDVKRLYAKAMAVRWCDKKDRKFCELAFYKLYNYDIAKYLRQNEVPLILSLALYDVERGDHLLTTVRAYVEKGVMPIELGILTGQIDIEQIISTVAGILKAVGDVTPELLVAIWQIIASRSKTLPPLETIRDNVILNAVLSEMEKRGYVVKDGKQYKLTDRGRTIAADVRIPLEVEIEKLKSFRYVTPAFYVVLNASNGVV